MPSEFELIDRHFASVAAQAADVVLGLGDDCALVQPPASDELLANSTDTLVEGVHFLPDIAAEDLAWRLVSASVSDLAAMGARPLWFSLAITLPDGNDAWLVAFSRGLKAALKAYSITLIGGDTTSGATRVLTAHVQGAVKPEQALKRSGAQVGDLIFVSGTLGDSRAGLELLSHAVDSADYEFLTQRFLRPTARVELGCGLTQLASAAIDISDGLLADLSHILKASGVGALVHLEQLPLSDSLAALYSEEQSQEWAATGGEDFELCFTAPAGRRDEIQLLAKELGLELTCIGEIRSGNGLQVLSQGEPWAVSGAKGFDHFGEDESL